MSTITEHFYYSFSTFFYKIYFLLDKKRNIFWYFCEKIYFFTFYFQYTYTYVRHYSQHSCSTSLLRKDRLKTIRWARGRLLLVAVHIAGRIHIAVPVSTVNEAVHVAIRFDAAAEIGGITVDAGRVHIAAYIWEDLLNMFFFYCPVIYLKATYFIVSFYKYPVFTR